jgi:hypothetical protein
MRPALDPVGHRVPRTKPTCLLRTWRPRRRRPFALVLHLHQHQSSRNLHLQYLANSQSTEHCQSLITQGSDHPPVPEPHMVLRLLRQWSWGSAGKLVWDHEKMALTGDLTGPSKMKSSELKRCTMVRTDLSSKWAIQTLVSVVTHEVPLPGVPTVGI